MTPFEYLHNKNIVIMGLGVFGGGVASAKFCYTHGAQVLVTDLRNENVLKESLKQFTKQERENITFILGTHRKKDFQKADMVIVNPGVPRTSEYLKIAREHDTILENDASLFMRFSKLPTIGVTGTRGKTTTVNWIAQLLSHHIGPTEPIGNSSKNPLLDEVTRELQKNDAKNSVHVAELSSWQLEILPQSKRAPHIAVITNIYPDHLNRYRGIKDYARAKAQIFKYQTKDDILILNYDNVFCDFYLKKKPKSQLYFFSLKTLPQNMNGIYRNGNSLVFQKNGVKNTLLSVPHFEKKWGTHNLANLLTSILAIHVLNPQIKITQSQINALAEVPYRQQTIVHNKNMRVVNDSTATSPDGLIAAIRRFASEDTVFISGGTRKDLSFADAAFEIQKNVQPEKLVLLSGTATDDLLRALKNINYDMDKVTLCDSLKKCIEVSLEKKPKNLVFSPGAASFEKFKNEFDRGQTFDLLIRELLPK